MSIQFYGNQMLFYGGAVGMHSNCCCCDNDGVCDGEPFSVVYGIQGVIEGVPDFDGGGTAYGNICNDGCGGECTYSDEWLVTVDSSLVNGTYDGALYPIGSDIPLSDEETDAILAGLADPNAADYCRNVNDALGYVWKFPGVPITYTATHTWDRVRTCIPSDDINQHFGPNTSTLTWSVRPDFWVALWGDTWIDVYGCHITLFEGITGGISYHRDPLLQVPLIACTASLSSYGFTVDHSTITVPPSSTFGDGHPAACADYTVTIDNGTVTGSTTVTLILTPP